MEFQDVVRSRGVQVGAAALFIGSALVGCGDQPQRIVIHAACPTTTEILSDDGSAEEVSLNNGAVLFPEVSKGPMSVDFDCASIDGMFESEPVITEQQSDSATGNGIYTIEFPEQATPPTINHKTGTIEFPTISANAVTVTQEFVQFPR